MRRMLLAVVFFAAAAAVCGADWYAAPDGTADGTGSIERPWDLATALGHPPAVEPGDVINLRGGTYRGTYTPKLQGTAEAPITVRSHAWLKSFAEWQSTYGQDGDGTYHDRMPDGRDDEVLMLGSTENRRLVAAINFAAEPVVAVDLAGWLADGDVYTVRHAANWHHIVAAGEYRGGELLVPMGMPESIAVPVGWEQRLIEPDVRFGCFVVQRVAAVARRSVRDELDDHERRIRALETK